jgi:hypothetical protein
MAVVVEAVVDAAATVVGVADAVAAVAAAVAAAAGVGAINPRLRAARGGAGDVGAASIAGVEGRVR